MKIKNFGFIDTNKNTLIIEIGLNKDIFPIIEENKEEDWRRIHPMSMRKHGLVWEFNEKTVCILDDEDIFGYPTVAMDSVIAIYFGKPAKYPPPNNAVVYHADGSIKHLLKAPSLTSKLAQEKLSGIEPGVPSTLYFDTVKWALDTNGNKVSSMRIVFAYEWFEERVLNPETGEFGECLSSGRL